MIAISACVFPFELEFTELLLGAAIGDPDSEGCVGVSVGVGVGENDEALGDGDGEAEGDGDVVAVCEGLAVLGRGVLVEVGGSVTVCVTVPVAVPVGDDVDPVVTSIVPAMPLPGEPWYRQ